MKKIIAITLFYVALFIIAELTGIRSNFTIKYIQSIFLNNILISSAIFITLFTIANLLQIPGWIFLVASISALGKVHGATLTYLAANISCLISFLIVGKLGDNALRQVDNNYAKKLLSNLDQAPLKSMVTLRIIFQTFPPINYALALSGVSVKNYILACIIGLPVPIMILTVFSDYFFKRFL